MRLKRVFSWFIGELQPQAIAGCIITNIYPCFFVRTLSYTEPVHGIYGNNPGAVTGGYTHNIVIMATCGTIEYQ